MPRLQQREALGLATVTRRERKGWSRGHCSSLEPKRPGTIFSLATDSGCKLFSQSVPPVFTYIKSGSNFAHFPIPGGYESTDIKD